MAENLLAQSGIFLFGRLLDDLKLEQARDVKRVRLATTENVAVLNGNIDIDGVVTATNNKVLVKDQQDPADNGIYTTDANAAWNKRPADQPRIGDVVMVELGEENGGSSWRRTKTKNLQKFKFVPARHGERPSLGPNKQLQDQAGNGQFARIYGFSYEGVYYDLPRPTLFLVHGDGDPATMSSRIRNTAPPPHFTTRANLARAPQEPSVTGVAVADFQFADDIRVWSYDKADFTIRMDVETGMFEQVLLDAYFSDGGHVSGMKVAGSRVSGMKVSGMKVSGMKVAGSRLGRGDAGD